MRITFITLLIFFCIASCTTRNPVPTDEEMTERFSRNKEGMEKLVTFFLEDSLRYFPLSPHNIRKGDTLTISRAREVQYINLMEQLSISHIGYSCDMLNVKSVILYHFGKGGIGWSVDKGYEYIITTDADFKYEEGELWDESQKYNYVNLRKKLDDRWNLYLNYDK